MHLAKTYRVFRNEGELEGARKYASEGKVAAVRMPGRERIPIAENLCSRLASPPIRVHPRCGRPLLLTTLEQQKKRFGVLTNKRIYSDTAERPGKTLYAKSVNLIGKPDYLIEQKGMVIPVEVKTGKTPPEPYLNHTMQLMAYCLLVEENYRKRPPGGYVRYPNQEFHLQYTDEARASLLELIGELNELKRTNVEQRCGHPEHNTDGI